MKALIFDCFGVLAESGWQTIERQFSPTKEQWQDLMDVSHACDLGTISVDELIGSFTLILNSTDLQIRQILDGQNVNSDMIALIRGLKPRYKIGMLSNVGKGMIQDLFSEDELSLFDALALSSEMGIAKPNIGAYEKVAAMLKVQAEDCIFVDDMPRNVEAAKEAGMSAHVYEDMGGLRDFLADSNIKLSS